MESVCHLSKEARFAVTCVRQACQLSRRIEEEWVPSTLEKEDRSPVTVADLAVQALVGQAVTDRFPGIPLVAEESSETLTQPGGEAFLQRIAGYLAELRPGVTKAQVRHWIDRGQGSTCDRFWILDPVDGTKGFLRGGQYAVALALLENHQVEVGVLGCPHLDIGLEELCSGAESGRPSMGSLFLAVRGQGAWVSHLGTGDFSVLQVSRCKETAEAVVLRSFESGHTNVDQMTRLVECLGVREKPILMDSQAKYGLLASGKGDLLFRLISRDRETYRERIWDQAAGSLLVEEAGGRITDLDGKPLDFSAGRKLEHNRGVLASNGLLHAAALAAIRSIRA